MLYRIIAYCWDENDPVAVIDLKVKENAWFMFHRYLEIGPQQAENINLIELYEIDENKNESRQLAGCQF